MGTLFSVLTYIGAAIGLLFVLASFGMSAPQQAAATAVALFFVAAPYCVHGIILRNRADRRSGDGL